MSKLTNQIYCTIGVKVTEQAIDLILLDHYQNKPSDWISVEDRLPEGERVILLTSNMGMSVASRGGDWKLDGSWGEWRWDIINGVTLDKSEGVYWQPLPEPPKPK